MSIVAIIIMKIVSINTTVMSLVLYQNGAAVNTLSISFINSLKKANNLTVYDKKRNKSCFPLKIKSNSFGYIQRFTTVKATGLISYWTLRSLLLIKK